MAKADFEKGLTRLEEIADKLERGEADLDASLTLYEEGLALVGKLEAALAGAERRIALATVRADGGANGEADLADLPDVGAGDGGAAGGGGGAKKGARGTRRKEDPPGLF